ncbi:GDP-L-fucose synthase [mine drainage metagenome]|uniref:GDP-L-fucose synthase n=1 Tax=mine drainage metagenome TaxID=410659 RepID=A0A1J5PL68_9ZZZZ
MNTPNLEIPQTTADIEHVKPAIAKTAKIYVSGHHGMVGSAIMRRLGRAGYGNLLVRSHDQLDLLDQRAVLGFLKREKPDFIFCAAAKVGGINANNNYRADFIFRNLMIQNNLIHGAFLAGVRRLLFLGSSCAYPRDCPQPIREEYLLTSPLEHTNAPYALAKIAGIKMCEAYNDQYGTRYASVMPTNLYGTNDNYDLANSHVLPALLRKAHEAMIGGDRTLMVWGSGRPRREFLHVDDMADACVFLMEQNIGEGLYNIGTGVDVSIGELAGTITQMVGFEGDIAYDTSQPDGTPRKLLDVSRMTALGWRSKISLPDGIRATYSDYVSNRPSNTQPGWTPAGVEKPRAQSLRSGEIPR